MAAALYTGEDITIVIDLVDDIFTDMADVIVGVLINENLMVSFKKTSGTVYAVTGDANQCSVKLTRAITKTWEAGMLSMEITKVFTDSNYPSGKHVIYKDNIVQFVNAVTKSL
jgi:hypothetical protein